MAFEVLTNLLGTQVAAVDLSAHQYGPVVIDTAGKWAVPAAGAVAHGVLLNKPTAGQVAQVWCIGPIVKVRLVASANIAIGDFLSPNGTTAVFKEAVTTNDKAAVALAASNVAAEVVIPAIFTAGILGVV